MNWRVGDTGYIIVNARKIVEVKIKSIRGGFCVVLPAGTLDKGICLRESRLFHSPEEAKKNLPPSARDHSRWYPH